MKLGVNVDHVATLREARYRGRSEGEPCPVAAAVAAVRAGATGVTAHLREDRRHMQDRDIHGLREAVKARFNFEMANTPEMVEIARRVRPEVVCVVPEKRLEVTTEGGLDATASVSSLACLCEEMRAMGVEVSLFIDPDPKQAVAAAEAGADFVELHTGALAESGDDEAARGRELSRLRDAAVCALEQGLRVNAGHGLNYDNVHLMAEIPGLEELNIGHSIVSRAVSVGMEGAVREMVALIERARSRGGPV